MNTPSLKSFSLSQPPRSPSGRPDQLMRRLHQLGVGAAIIAGAACALPNGGETPQAGDPLIGTQVEATYLSDFYPPFRAGMQYAYVGVERQGEIEKSNRLEAEVLETTADTAKIRVTLGGKISQITEINRRQDPPVLPPGGITFEGREQITVPAGSFNAQKFSYTQNKSRFNAWGEKGVGLLKILERRPNGDTVTTELQSYVK
ncbi:MAG: hypothetical protein ACO1RX_15960 [Candidatus Sericytochromatia bacterium]